MVRANVKSVDRAQGDVGLGDDRVWPHHFDLGALLKLTAEKPDHMLGLGLSPGDTGIDMPYFYCSPYPQVRRESRRHAAAIAVLIPLV